jgi:hypothetical protein
VFRTIGISTTTCLAAGNTAVGDDDFLRSVRTPKVHYVDVEVDVDVDVEEVVRDVDVVVGAALATAHKAVHIMTENFILLK